MITYLVTIFWIISFTGFISTLFKRTFEECALFSLIIGVYFLYAGGLINHISWGYYLSFIPVLLFWITLIILVFKKDYKTIHKIKSRMITTGLFVFVIICLVAFVIQSQKGFVYWDDFGHWGPMVKESLKLDRFYSVGISTMQRHKDYPPFFTLLEILFCHFDGGVYKESTLITTMLIFHLMLFLPLFSKIKTFCKKDLIKLLFVLFITFISTVIIQITPTAPDTARILNSAYIDWTMSAYCAYIFFIITYKKDALFDTLNIALLMGSVLMMKQMGLPFYLLLLLYAVLIEFFTKEKKDWKSLIAYIVIPILFYLSWKMVIDHTGASTFSQFKISDINLSSFLAIAKGTFEDAWRHEAFVNFVDAALRRPLMLRPIALSYCPIAIILSILILLITKDKKHKFILFSVYLFGAIAYSFAMLLLYVFCFNSHEGPMLASFDRYMAAFLYMGIIVILFIFVERFILHKNYGVYFLVFCLSLCFFIEPRDLVYFNPNHKTGLLQSENVLTDILQLDELTKDDKTLIINQGDDDYWIYTMLYYAQNDSYKAVKMGKAQWSGDVTENMTFNEWKNFLSEFDYIYILKSDYNFENDYWNQTTNEAVQENVLYKIDLNENINLIKID